MTCRLLHLVLLKNINNGNNKFQQTPTSEASGARAIENQRSIWFSMAFFVSFLEEQKRKECNLMLTLLIP